MQGWKQNPCLVSCNSGACNRITLERRPVFCMWVYIKMVNPSSFLEHQLFWTPSGERGNSQTSLPSLDSSRCSCPCLCRSSPIRVPLCPSFPFPPGSHSHLALSQHRYWSGSLNFQPEELWWAGGEAAGGSDTSWAQAGTMQWACM